MGLHAILNRPVGLGQAYPLSRIHQTVTFQGRRLRVSPYYRWRFPSRKQEGKLSHGVLKDNVTPQEANRETVPTTPRNTESITFSLPPEIGERMQHVMKKEGRTLSKLIRDALRNYKEERVRQEAHRLNVPVVEPGREWAGG